jgi:hypothetical protein
MKPDQNIKISVCTEVGKEFDFRVKIPVIYLCNIKHFHNLALQRSSDTPTMHAGQNEHQLLMLRTGQHVIKLLIRILWMT